MNNVSSTTMRPALFSLRASVSCIASTAAAPVRAQQNSNEPMTLSDIASRGFTVPACAGVRWRQAARGLALLVLITGEGRRQRVSRLRRQAALEAELIAAYPDVVGITTGWPG